jgi:hypothetical protein
LNLRLSISRGPVGPDALDAIGETYGTVDRSYASRAFCEELFNRNPYGHSWHAFVTDGDVVVGHYAVIPMRASARGTTVLSGKGEALFLHEAYRSSPIECDAGTLPAGIALMNLLHQCAFDDGVTVIYNISSAGIGMIQRMNGFRSLSVRRDQHHFLISPGLLRQLREGRARVAARALMVAQRLLLALAPALLRAVRAPRVRFVPLGEDDPLLAALVKSGTMERESWSMARDLETLHWLRRLDRLEIVALIPSSAQFAVLSKGNARELLHWNISTDDWKGGLAVVCALAGEAVRERAWIVSVPRRMIEEGGRALRFATRALGFYRRTSEQVIYVKSRDPFYLDAGHLTFDRRFSL